MIRILFGISFTCLSLLCIAQEEFIEPARFLTRFSFRQYNGGIIMLRAKLNKIPDSLNFILDTGSGAISLDSQTCSTYKISHKTSGKILSGIAGRKEVDHTTGNTLHLPGLSINNLDFYINDYEILSTVYGEKIDGVIGYSFFSRYIVRLNFDSMFLEIFKPGDVQYPKGGYLLRPNISTIPMLPVRVKDSKTVNAEVYYDTGAGLCFLLTKDFMKDSALLSSKRKPVMIQAEGLGGKRQMQMTVMKELKIGPYHFRRVPIHIFEDEFNAISYPSLGGLIGNDILRRFNQTINYSKKEIYLIPNSHFGDPFDYSYTGLSLYVVDNKIVVDDVISNSPAGRAGFKAKDVIISINNDFSNNIQRYKNMMQSQGKILTVILMRDEKPVVIEFKVGKIN